MATLKEKAQQILDEKQAKILPENIKKDIQIFDIVGTVDEGVDTSDADALAEDIVENKTAYVNGVKIVGNIRKYDTEDKFLLSSMVVSGFSDDGAYIYGTPDQFEHGCPAYIPDYDSITVRFQKTGLRSYLGITPEILKKDTTVLGVTGTLEEVIGQEKTVTPTNKQQIIVPDEGYNALTSVTVEASESTSVDSKYSPHQFDELEEISIGNTFMIDETRFNETPNIGDKYYFVNYSTSEMNLNLCVCKVLSTEDDIQYKCEVLDVVPVVDGYSIPKDFVEIIEGDVGTPSISAEEASVFMKFIENVPAISLMPNSTISVSVKNETLAAGIGLTPDKIKLGENILGIDGEYEGETTSEIPFNSVITDKTIKYIPYKEDGTSLWNTSSMTNMYEFAKDCINLKTIPLLNTSNSIMFSQMFSGCTSLETIPSIDTSKGQYFVQMFYNCENLVYVPTLDLSSATNVSSMFNTCENLISVDLINTTNVTNMSTMFENCPSLVNIPELDTTSVENMWYMFNYCTSLSNDSLNNILAMLINATNYTGTKALNELGLSQEQATVCTTLSNWSACQSAGWTTGY